MSIQSFLAVSAAYLFNPPTRPAAEARSPDPAALALDLGRVRAWRRLITGDLIPAPRRHRQYDSETAA